MAWMLEHVLTLEERNALKLKVATWKIRTGSMCAGMGTEEIVMEGLRRALQLHGTPLQHQSVFKAEKDPAKMNFLKAHFSNTGTMFVWDNRDLAKAAFTDAEGRTVRGRPTVDALFCGIVCKDIFS